MMNNGFLSPQEIEKLYKEDYQGFLRYKEKVCKIPTALILSTNNKGELVPLVLTKGQEDIFFEIFTKWHKRVMCITPTRYGKSNTVSAAIVCRLSLFPREKWVVVAPSLVKARIIMDNVILFFLNSPGLMGMIPLRYKNKTEQLKNERSKERITLGNGSEVKILSADADSKVNAGRKLMGHGAKDGLIVDESAEINDEIFATIFRMLADNLTSSFMCQLGNPWFLNHFYDDWLDSNHVHIRITWQQAIEEGRLTLEYIEEAKKKPNFSILFDGLFPDADVIDREGWMPLFNLTTLGTRYVPQVEHSEMIGKKTMGLDVSYAGGDQNVWCVRDAFTIRVVSRDNNKEPIQVVGKTMELARLYGIEPENIYMDATAGGNIIYSAFAEQGFNVNPVNFAEAAMEKELYRDQKTEGYFLFAEWINKGGMLIEDGSWDELKHIKYKRIAGRMSLISKEDLRKLIRRSTDTGDAAMLTCIGGISDSRAEKSETKPLKDYEVYDDLKYKRQRVNNKRFI